MKLFQIRARSFTAGLTFDDDDLCTGAAPILRKILNLSARTALPLWEVEALCFSKGWKLILVSSNEREES